ncbi:MAG: hypothetical protein HY746_02390 [Elusimicrobia bacterium]|nr:hypothetical protein [Elusimicrobiota bacterium]
MLLQFLLISIYPVFAQESGVFLKIPVSPIAGGMGDLSAVNDAFGMYYNPAGIAFTQKPVVSLAQHVYVQDISGNSLSFVYPFKKWAIGLASTLFSMKEEPIYDSFGNPTGESFGYKAGIYPVTVAKAFGNLGIGSSIKYYSETISEQSGTMTFDIGAIYRTGPLQFGFASMNLGGKVFDYDLVRIQRLGAAYSKGKYVFSADIKKEGQSGSFVNAGAEVGLADMLKLRGGWRFKEDFGGLCFGLGLKLGNFNFDYAFLSYGDLGNTHKAGISYLFGKKEKKEIEKPKEEFVKPVIEKKVPPVIPPVVKSTEAVNIAVAEFTGKNVSMADASIVADFLRTELVNTGLFNVMDRNNMETVLAEQKFQASGCTEQQCAVEMGKLLNVRQMVIGSLSKLLDTYYITVNLIDVQTGRIIASFDQEASSAKELKQACRTLAQKLSKR